MFRNVKALILNDRGTWRRDENHTTTISSPVSRTEALKHNSFRAFSYVRRLQENRRKGSRHEIIALAVLCAMQECFDFVPKDNDAAQNTSGQRRRMIKR